MNLGSATYYSEIFHKCPVSSFGVFFYILRDIEPLSGYLKYVEGVHKTIQLQKVALNQASSER